MKNIIYKITINNWNKYNKNLKKGHKAILISTGFLSDAKIRSLTPVTRLLYLSCLLVAGESTNSQIEVSHDSLVFQSGVKSGSLQSQLDLLQSLQLLTYEKIDVFINRIEKNRKEENRREKKINTPVVPKMKNESSEVIAHYCAAWRGRYGSHPPISQKTAGQIKRFASDHGVEKSKIFIDAYLAMADQWFLTKRHDFSTLLANLNGVSHFAQTGKLITQKEIKQFSEAQAVNALIESIKSEGI